MNISKMRKGDIPAPVQTYVTDKGRTVTCAGQARAQELATQNSMGTVVGLAAVQFKDRVWP